MARFLTTLHVDERDQVRRLLEESVAGAGDYQTEYRVVRTDGRTLWVLARCAVERDASGSPTGMYGVSFDVTPLKEEERELLRQHAELAHLSRVSMLGELSGSLAHELNQQVAGRLGTVEKTIKVHRACVMEKMQASSLADLVRLARRVGVGPR